MDCKDAKKHIHEYLDGDADLSAVSAHLEQCTACRTYLRDMQKQKALLSTLSAKNAPSFDLAAARRRKKANLSRTVSWASAAAAVFVVVLIAGSMTGLFSGAKAEAPMEVRTMGEEAAPAPAAEEAGFAVYAAEEAAPAKEAPAEAEEAAAPMEEAPAEEAAAEEAPAMEEAPEEEAAEERDPLSAAELHTVTLPENQLNDLISLLVRKGISPKSSDNGYVLYVTDSNIDLLSEIFSQYTDIPLSAGTSVCIRKE